jgi:hypothetical protein
MSEWPKNPATHVAGTLEPVGPLNVFVEKVAIADAINRAIDVKTLYDETHSAPPPAATAVPRPAPIGPPIVAGRPVTIDQSRYMIDSVFIGRKVIPRRR